MNQIPQELAADLEALCVELAVTTGRFIRDDRPDRVEVAATKSSATDVVTAMDQAGEERLRHHIRQARPDDGILGEEGVDVEGRSGLTWVIDPIDGTVNYLYDLPAYSVSVAVVEGDPHVEGQWRPIAGAISHPALRVVHHARVGGGAWTADEDGSGRRPMAVSRQTDLAQSLLGTGFSYSADTRTAEAQRLLRVLPAVRDIRRMGSAAIDLAAVAAGSLDAYAESELNPWDLAAGWLLVTEAGGEVRGLGDTPGRALVVAGPPALVPRVQELFSGA